MHTEAVVTEVTFLNVSAAPFLLVIFTGFVAAGVRLHQIHISEQRRDRMWEESDFTHCSPPFVL